jgi:hypothetical protein
LSHFDYHYSFQLDDPREISEGSVGMGNAMAEFMSSLAAAPQSYLPKVLSLSLGSMSWYEIQFIL